MAVKKKGQAPKPRPDKDTDNPKGPMPSGDPLYDNNIFIFMTLLHPPSKIFSHCQYPSLRNPVRKISWTFDPLTE